MKKSIYLLMGLIVSLVLVISCTPKSHFGVKDQTLGYPSQFDETEVAIAQAERSPGAKYCPEKIAKAKELGTKGVETYWACRTAEAMKLLAEARALAKEAEGCQPPPPPAPLIQCLLADSYIRASPFPGAVRTTSFRNPSGSLTISLPPGSCFM